MLMLLRPAGLEGLIREQSVLARRMEPPAPSDMPPPDAQQMREIALSYGCELLP